MGSLTKKIIIALILGVIVGIGLTFVPDNIFSGIDYYVLDPIGQIFLNLILMTVVPVVFVSLVLGVAGLGEPSKLGKIGTQALAFFLGTSAISLSIGVAVGYIFQPGNVGSFDLGGAEFEAQETPPMMETLVNIIPENPIASMATGDMLQIIAFAVFVGLGIAVLGEKANRVKTLFEQINDIMMWMITTIMKFAPYGTFALVASAIGDAGLDAIGSMAMYMFCVILALFIQGAVVYSLLIKFLGKASPLKFYKGFYPAMTVAFSTSSSNATLPISMKAAQENLGVKKSISSFVQPLGATINMDGTGIIQAVAAVFISQAYGVGLTFTDVVIIILTATLASIGTAGVPGVGLVMLAMVLNQVGLPVDGIALIIGIDRVLDMLRTSLNITGDAVCAYIISENEKRKEAKMAKAN